MFVDGIEYHVYSPRMLIKAKHSNAIQEDSSICLLGRVSHHRHQSALDRRFINVFLFYVIFLRVHPLGARRQEKDFAIIFITYRVSRYLGSPPEETISPSRNAPRIEEK